MKWAWKTPLGEGESARSRLLAGETALKPVQALQAYGISEAAEIPLLPSLSPHSRYLHRLALLALEAAREIPVEGGPELGVFTALGGLRALWEDLLVAMKDQKESEEDPWGNGLVRVHPYWMLRHLSNNAHALLAIEKNATGEGATFAGETAGAQALAGALRTLRTGRIQRALLLGYDSLLQPEILLEGALSNKFSQYGPGEAAVAILLEKEDALHIHVGQAPPLQPLPFSVQHAMGLHGAVTALTQLIGITGLGSGTWIAEAQTDLGLYYQIQVHQ